MVTLWAFIGKKLAPRLSAKDLIFKISKNKWYHANMLLKTFHLRGHIIGFRQQILNLEILKLLSVSLGKQL